MSKSREITLPKVKEDTNVRSFAIALRTTISSLITTYPNIPNPLISGLNVALITGVDIYLAIKASERANKRMQLLLNEINKKFKEQDKKITEIQDNIAYFWRKAIRESIEAANQEKVKYFAKLFTNAVTCNDKTNFSQKKSFFDDLSFFEKEHLRVLAAIKRSSEKNVTFSGPNYEIQADMEISQLVKELKLEHDLVNKIGLDLLNRGLVYDPMVGKYDYGGFKFIDLTTYGKKFIEFVLSKENLL